MIIRKRRIRSLEANLGLISKGTTIVPGVQLARTAERLLTEVGFQAMVEGETVLPSSDFGPASLFNAEGKYVKRKDEPMETAYRVREWSWIEWHGPDPVERSDFVEVPYQRYPRIFVPPPSIEMTIARRSDGEIVVVDGRVPYVDEGTEQLLHIVNLFLEIFGECEIFTEDLQEIIPATTRRVNWEILPPGAWPWEKLKERLQPVIDRAEEGNRAFIEHRFKTINEYKPDFKAFGTGGFRGYVIFGFEKRKLYVCESAYYGNATYIFGENWEALSKRTKAEIITGDLHEERIVHRKMWEAEMRRLLAKG